MILQALVRYYETLVNLGKVTGEGWCRAKTSYALDIGLDGTLYQIISLKIPEERGKKTVEVPQLLVVPQQASRAAGVSSNFLCDNSKYLLGIDGEGEFKIHEKRFQGAKEKHLEILKETGSEAAMAVRAFFESWNPETAAAHPAIAPFLEEIGAAPNLVFRYKDSYVHTDPEIKAAWESYRTRTEEGEFGICMVTGAKKQIARTHGLIRGVQGAQPSGAAIVSFNSPAFCSYGKEQNYNAPVGNEAVNAYTAALNYMLAERQHVCQLGDTTVVYWAESGEETYQMTFESAMMPSQEQSAQERLDGIFQSLASGKAVDLTGISFSEKFYVLGLAPNAARLAVNFFYQDNFGNILRHVKEHYDRMEIIRPSVDGSKYLGVWRMLQETVNKKSREKKPLPNLGGVVFRAILSGDRYPSALYQSVMGRIRAEQDDKDNHIYKITKGRAAIIKAYLLRNFEEYTKEEGITVALNEESNNIPYTLGRTFAVLESIQQDANPGINATIKDRYFNSACATPASIFPILFKLKNSHIRKIDSPKLQVWYEKLLQNILEKLSLENGETLAYPRRLTLEEQGMFVLGYYHQMQKKYEKKVKEETSDVRAD
ncbi:type I-C CRISPR-associated protein Cas8c/Csd1 [Anaerolentibacter hominis]|uniref:type I-C CRISPR-associated protein Cas8c/Csd1 n=1 Tax=Anaerolentibacter hominis TaxID=3079009 RepID=UPI0031B83EC0